MEDIFNNVEIWRTVHATRVLLILHEVLDDCQVEFDSPCDDASGAEVSLVIEWEEIRDDCELHIVLPWIKILDTSLIIWISPEVVTKS